MNYSDYGPLDRYDAFNAHDQENYNRGIKKLYDEIDRLKGMDTEKDLEICTMIRDRIMAEPSPDGINQLTSALVNMTKVIKREVE